ncbi:MAG: pyridoxal phosphate-dependent aminotransferase [Nitrospinota bacterium]|nr:pyridoxal phosphate-dependent aminotransferase [Nitrospinota bacterium]
MTTRKKNRDTASERSLNIPSFKVMDIMEKGQAMEAMGERIVHLEIGEPDFDTPEVVKEAAIAAIREGRTKYTHSLGLDSLRRAIRSDFLNEYGVEVSLDRIMVTAGTSNGLQLLLAALIERGDEVIMATPCYSCYPNFVSYLGGKPVMIRVREEEKFELRPEEVRKKITRRTKAILINSPSNPTGMVMSAKTMEQLAHLGPIVVSDEIYHGLVYEGRANSILEFTDRAFAINGFSKRYAMTGWRLGYIIAPEQYIRPMQKIQQNFAISVNSFVQWGGVAALEKGGEFLQKTLKTYNKRRMYMQGRMEEIGLPVLHPPQGAYYFFANASHLSKDSLSLSHDILEQAKVAVTPGMDFGPGGEGYLRLTYASSLKEIKLGLTRLERYISKGPHVGNR